MYLPRCGCKRDLITTDLRKINDTNTNVPGSATTYAIENTCPANPIGDSFNVQTQFILHKYPYTSDISKAYLRINVNDETAGLLVFIWYDDLENLQNPVYYLRRTMDFGDGVASAILTIAQNKKLHHCANLLCHAES